MAVSISLKGISPLHGSHVALPIACDASNARTVAIGEYHYIFCAVMACKVLRLLCGRIFLARLPCREVSCSISFHLFLILSWLGFRVGKCHGVFSAQLRHKRKVSGLPYDTPPLSCGYICQRTGGKYFLPCLRKGERRLLQS